MRPQHTFCRQNNLREISIGAVTNQNLSRLYDAIDMFGLLPLADPRGETDVVRAKGNIMEAVVAELVARSADDNDRLAELLLCCLGHVLLWLALSAA